MAKESESILRTLRCPASTSRDEQLRKLLKTVRPNEEIGSGVCAECNKNFSWTAEFAIRHLEKTGHFYAPRVCQDCATARRVAPLTYRPFAALLK